MFRYIMLMHACLLVCFVVVWFGWMGLVLFVFRMFFGLVVEFSWGRGVFVLSRLCGSYQDELHMAG